MELLRTRAAICILFAALLAPSALLALDRAPEILGHDQVGASIRLLWAPGGKADGTIDPTVTAYAVEKQGLGLSAWTTVFPGTAQAMTYVDSVAVPGTWDTYQGQSIRYRVRATSGTGQTLSPEVSFVPSLPLWVDEALDGKARLTWVPSNPSGQYTIHLGYKVEKFVSGSWVIISGSNYIQTTSYLDANSAPGFSQYRVRTVYKKNNGASTNTRFSNTGSIQIQTACQGQAPDPALPTIVIGDLDSDTDYDGNDIALALVQCAGLGGCVLRALPVTYDNVAVRITERPDCNPDASPTYPIQCIPNADSSFASGLVIEGYGKQTVFRSPLWQSLNPGGPVPLPAPVLEILRLGFPFKIRNLVLDGRKFEQLPPSTSAWHSWWYGGLYVWNTGPWRDEIREISGDSLGNDNGYCDYEECFEDPTGNDGDGRCEAGEQCHDASGLPGTCNNEYWTNVETCESTLDMDDGCIHNVEVRDVPGAYGVLISHANRWIVEDSEFHDVGCVNRGYGYDCPTFASAVDAGEPPGFKTYGIGLHIGDYTADFQVLRNDVYRATKYGLSFKNQNATDCNGLLRNHEVAYNDVRDLGAVGIFNHGSVGARIHDNTIGRTTTWNAPDYMNGYEGPFGMSLGGVCSDDNQFTNNAISDSEGMGIYWNGAVETVTCSSPTSCAALTPVGNTIGGNTVTGTCLDKDTDPAGPSPFGYGSLHFAIDASGPMSLAGNTLTNSQCASAIVAWGPRGEWIDALDLRMSGGSYESGPNALTAAQSFFCGAVMSYGDNRKIVIGDDVSITNPNLLPSIPRACLGYGATLVVDDVPTDPFDSSFTGYQTSGGATVVECSAQPSHPDCQ